MYAKLGEGMYNSVGRVLEMAMRPRWDGLRIRDIDGKEALMVEALYRITP